MRKTVGNLLTLRSLAIACTMCTLSLGALSWYIENEWWQGILADLAITSLGILITVFLIDRIVERHECQKWEGVMELANKRVRIAAFRAIGTLQRGDPDAERNESYWYAYEHNRNDPIGHWRALSRKPRWREYILDDMVGEMRNFLFEPSQKPKVDLKLWAKSVEYDYDQVLDLFKEVLTPQQIEALIESKEFLRLAQFGDMGEYTDVRQTGFVRNVIQRAVYLIDNTSADEEDGM